MAARYKIADIFAAFKTEGVEQYNESLDKAQEKAQKAADAAAKVGQAMVVAGAAITAVAGLAVREAAQFETLEVRLQAIFNSTTKGTKAFKELQEVAAKTPFSLQGVVRAGATLAAYMGKQKDQAVELTGSIADLAAFMGDDIPQAASAFGRAFAAGAGAADMLRERGVLALVADFAKMKYGVEDLTKMTLPEFRKVLIEAIRDPSLGIAGSTEKLAKTFVGGVSNMKDAISQLSAAFGKEMLPGLNEVVRGLTKFIQWVNKIPSGLKAVIAWGGSTAGIMTLLGGAVLMLIPKLVSFIYTLRSLGIALSAANLGIAGIITIIIAATAALIGWTIEMKRAAAAADKQSRSLQDVIDALKKVEDEGKTGTAIWHNLKAQMLELQAAYYREQGDLKKEAEALEYANQHRMQAVTTTKQQVATFDELAYAQWQLNQATEDRLFQLPKEAEATQQAGGAWRTFAQQVEEARAKLQMIAENAQAANLALKLGLPLDPATWSTEMMERFQSGLSKLKDKTDDFGQAIKSASETMAQSFGNALGQMVKDGKLQIDQLIIMLIKLVAKMMLVLTLKALLGPIGGQFAGGLMSGLFGFEDPKMDTKAFRWGFDFARQFHEGVNASLLGGLRVPSMQPAPVPAGAAGGGRFDVHVHNATPDTYVRIVQAGVASMSDADAFGLFRQKLGPAADRWSGL